MRIRALQGGSSWVHLVEIATQHSSASLVARQALWKESGTSIQVVWINVVFLGVISWVP